MSHVSIIMPAYNAGRFIETAIQSVVNQDYSDWELIVVDDGSTDDTADRVEAIAIDEPRLNLMRKNNGGKANAVNDGFTRARGELIKVFDADDLMDRDLLSAQVARLENTNFRTVVNGPWRRFHTVPNDMALAPSTVWRDLPSLEWVLEACSDAQPMMQCGAWLIPAELVRTAGGWDERLSLIDDFEYYVRSILHADQVLFAPSGTLHYRSGEPGTLSRRDDDAAIQSMYLSLSLGIDHIIDTEDSRRTRQVCVDLMQYFIYAVFPARPDLLAKAGEIVQRLDVQPSLSPPGPAGFQALRRVIGWRLARQAQNWATARGLNRAGLRRYWTQ